jgi:hypothetical protein
LLDAAVRVVHVIPSGEVITAPMYPTATYLSDPQHTLNQYPSDALVRDVHEPYEADVPVCNSVLPMTRAFPAKPPVTLSPVAVTLATFTPLLRNDRTPLPASETAVFEAIFPKYAMFPLNETFDSVGPSLKTTLPAVPVLVVVPVPPLATEMIPSAAWTLAILMDVNPYPLPS